MFSQTASNLPDRFSVQFLCQTPRKRRSRRDGRSLPWPPAAGGAPPPRPPCAVCLSFFQHPSGSIGDGIQTTPGGCRQLTNRTVTRSRCSLPWPPAAGGLRPPDPPCAVYLSWTKPFGVPSGNGMQPWTPCVAPGGRSQLYAESVPTEGTARDLYARSKKQMFTTVASLSRLGGSAPQTPLWNMCLYCIQGPCAPGSAADRVPKSIFWTTPPAPEAGPDH